MLSFELEPGHRGRGGGTGLIRDALSAIRPGELVLAAVALGNAASVRVLLPGAAVGRDHPQVHGRATRTG